MSPFNRSHYVVKPPRANCTPGFYQRQVATLSDPSQTDRTDITTRSLSLRADTIDEKSRSVEAVLATENRVQVFDYETYRVIDEILIARGIEHAPQIVLLESHMRWGIDSILGSIRDIKVDGSTVVGRLFFAEGDERSDGAWLKVRQGHLTDVSVGYFATDFVDIKAGETATVDGRTFTAAERTLRITTAWTAREGSLVPIGADEATKIREHQQPRRMRARETEKHMKSKLRAYLNSLGLRADADEAVAWDFFHLLDGTQRAEAERLNARQEETSEDDDGGDDDATGDAGTSDDADAPATSESARRSTPPDNSDALIARAQRAERRRIDSIMALSGEDVSQDIIKRAISEGWTVERASQAVLQAVRDGREEAADAAPGVITGREATQDALAAAIAIRSGADLVANARTDEQRAAATRLCEEADSQHLTDLSMFDSIAASMRMAGLSFSRNRSEAIELWCRAVSTGSMTNIFTTSVNALVLAGYAETIDTTGPFVQVRDVNDFKPNERTKLGKTGTLDQLPRGGEAQHATRSDSKESYSVARYAKQFRIDEQDIMDDRMDALQDIPRQLGEAAANVRPDLVYAILFANAALDADSKALFHADHGNLETGAAFAKATLQTAIKNIAVQQEDGKNLGLVGQTIIVPQALRLDAKTLVRSQTLITTDMSATTDSVGGNFNALSDEGLGVIADSRLDNGVTDPASLTVHTGSATSWYMAARAGRHTIEVGYIRGTGRGPTLRSFVLDKGSWGVGWDVKIDVGAKALDFRGLHKSEA